MLVTLNLLCLVGVTDQVPTVVAPSAVSQNLQNINVIFFYFNIAN